MFFYFLKIIFQISTSKRYENIKKISKKFFLNLRERGFNRVPKWSLNIFSYCSNRICINTIY
jgi:hypothetical protein